MAYEIRCQDCGEQLFDVPSFEAFKEPAPVTIACRGCPAVYKVSQDKDGDIVFKRPGWKKPKKANKYG